ncbi:MAG TPA: hypothetical protein VKG26_11020, partial [Bacteroidia bacterium]|nr:hypothetical protein [Bacteroidia bacterium]
MKYFLLTFLLCFFITDLSAEKKKVIAYDTSTAYSIKKASIQKEKEIFADKDFIYQKDAKETK